MIFIQRNPADSINIRPHGAPITTLDPGVPWLAPTRLEPPSHPRIGGQYFLLGRGSAGGPDCLSHDKPAQSHDEGMLTRTIVNLASAEECGLCASLAPGLYVFRDAAACCSPARFVVSSLSRLCADTHTASTSTEILTDRTLPLT